MLHDAFHVGFDHHAPFGGFQHHAHHRRVRHDFDDAIAHACIFEAVHHRLREAWPIQRIDAFDTVLHIVFGVHRRINGQITAFGMASEHNRHVLPQRGDPSQIVGRSYLRRHRVLEGHVEVFLPADQRIVRTTERHNQRAGRQTVGHRGELRLLAIVELFKESAHLNIGESRIRGDGMIEIVRHLRINQSHVLDVMVGHRTVVVKLVVGARDRNTIERRLSQHTNGTERMAEVKVFHTITQRAILRFNPLQSRHAVRHIIIRKLREHERIGLTEGVNAETARFRTCIVDDATHRTPLSQPAPFPHSIMRPFSAILRQQTG